MGKLYEDLFAQHRVAEGLLDQWTLQLVRLETGGATPTLIDEMDRTYKALYKDADHHFSEEEKALFPFMAEHVGGGADSILQAFLEDHKLFWEAMGRVGTALADLRSGRTEAVRALVDNIRYVLEMLPEHIEREDKMLFPMAQDMLDAEEWARAERARPE